MSADYAQLPPDLPIPQDDGGADHLTGLALPALGLRATTCETVDLAAIGNQSRCLVAYVYPRTGTPGEPLPAGWDDIPGARGCTPQSCAYRDVMAEFAALDATVVGISAQTPDEQSEFAQREHIPFPLLSDTGLQLRDALRLPTFDAGGSTLYKRLTLVADAGTIVKTFYPVFPPDRDAAEVLGWLGGRRRVSGGGRN